MDKKFTIIICIVNIFGLIFTITTLILSDKIMDETRDNPLESYEKELENMFAEDDDSTEKTKDRILEFTTTNFNELRKLSKFCQMWRNNFGQFLHRRANCIWMF